MKRPDRLIAQIMDIGDYDDVCRMVEIVGNDVLLQVLQNAEVGQFSEMSWHYWHYRLTDIPLGGVPPMPTRKFND